MRGTGLLHVYCSRGYSGGPLGFSQTRTQSTCMVVGSFVVASGLPGQSPPIATLKIKKNG